MAVISMKSLLDAGAHFGHVTPKWHPKMRNYIYGAKSGIYIIDLRKTLAQLKEAYNQVANLSSRGGKILFVGTKFQAREIIAREARRSNNFFINYRWLGGTLTNFNTIQASIKKLKKFEDLAGEDKSYPGVIKKEAAKMEKERRKMELVLGGIKDMRKMPAAIFIIDIDKESIALQEAKKLGIPIIAVVDTNCDPRDVDYLIPGNDDSLHSIELFTSVIASASAEGRKQYDNRASEAKKEKEAAQKEKAGKKAE